MRKVLGIIIALIVVVGIIFLIWNLLNSSKNSQQSSANRTLYENKNYGYSLTYPSTWGDTTSLGNGIVLFSNPGYLQERLKDPPAFNKADYTSISTSVYDYGAPTAGGQVTEKIDITQFAKANNPEVIIPGKKITIDGKEAVEFEVSNLVLKPTYPIGMQNCPSEKQSDCFTQYDVVKQVWVKLPKGLLLINNFIGRDYKNPNDANREFDAVVNSLKFN